MFYKAVLCEVIIVLLPDSITPVNSAVLRYNVILQITCFHIFVFTNMSGKSISESITTAIYPQQIHVFIQKWGRMPAVWCIWLWLCDKLVWHQFWCFYDFYDTFTGWVIDVEVENIIPDICKFFFKIRLPERQLTISYFLFILYTISCI